MSEVLTPKSIETKSGSNAKGKPWTLYRVEFSDGTKASTFDSATAKVIEANYGKPINVEISQGEKGKDLKGAWPLDGEAPAIKQRFASEKRSSDDFLRPRNPAESRHIAKQACLKAAVDFVNGKGRIDERTSGDVAATTGRVLAIADQFVEWVFAEEAGVRPMRADFTAADVAAERAAISGDKPADTLLKETVVGLLSTANADAKAVLHNYGLKTVGDVNAKLTERVAKLFMEANGKFDPDTIPL